MHHLRHPHPHHLLIETFPTTTSPVDCPLKEGSESFEKALPFAILFLGLKTEITAVYM